MLDEAPLGSGKITLATLERAFYDVPEGYGAMAVMGTNGDTKYIWDKTKPPEVEAARALFDSLRGSGYAAFSVKGDGEKDVLIHEFDPAIERVIFTPQMRGG